MSSEIAAGAVNSLGCALGASIGFADVLEEWTSGDCHRQIKGGGSFSKQDDTTIDANDGRKGDYGTCNNRSIQRLGDGAAYMSKLGHAPSPFFAGPATPCAAARGGIENVFERIRTFNSLLR